MTRILSILFICLCFQLSIFAQSSETLSLAEYLEQVKLHHPLSYQANLQYERGQSNLTQNRSGFDPKIDIDAGRKEFKDKLYYNLLDGKLKIPTWYGLEFQGGFEQNSGIFLNPENNVPSAGLVYAGVSVPLGEGLFIDERRAALKNARLFAESSREMRRSLYNDLMYNASSAYFEWFKAYHVLRIYEEAYQIASIRLRAVKQSAQLGDSPNIDTLEAGIQVQNRLLSLQQARLDFQNAGAFLNIFLWQEGSVPLELTASLIPENLNQLNYELLSSLSDARDTLIIQHPDYLRSIYKLEMAKIDRRWKVEQVKPKLNLKYNFLNEAVQSEALSSFTTNNYNFGLQFQMPILFRKERGALQLANIKIKESEYDISLKRANIGLKSNMAANKIQITGDQIQLYSQTVQDYSDLLEGERTKFRGGESSLFLVNSRELGYISARIKLVDLIAKNQKAKVEYDFALGRLADLIEN